MDRPCGVAFFSFALGLAALSVLPGQPAPVEKAPHAGGADPQTAFGFEPLNDLAKHDVLVARLYQGEDEVGMGIKLRAALLALASGHRLAARPEPPHPCRRRGHADAEAQGRLPG